MTEEKLQEASAPELASVAKSMSAVIKDMSPPSELNPNGPGTTFVIYAPSIAKEEKFPVIDVSNDV